MKFEKKHYIYLLIGLVCSILIFSLYSYTNIIDNFELLALNGMFKMRNDPPNPMVDVVQRNPRLNGSIIVVGIDEKALEKFGQWPFDRRLYGKLLKRIQRSKPAAVFYDIFILEPNLSQDTVFFNYLHETRDMKVIFDYPFEKKQGADFDKEKYKERFKLLEKKSFEVPPDAKSIQDFNFGALPLPGVLRNITGAGHAVIMPDSDATFRKIPLVVKFNGRLYPQVAFLVALNYLQVPLKNVEFKVGEYVLLKNAKVPKKDEFGDVIGHETEDIKIPIDKEGKMLINFAGHPGEFNDKTQYLSFAEAFTIDPEYFKDKILFIGAYAQGIAHDVWPTPHGHMYGIEINAFGLNTILQRDFLIEVPMWINFVIAVFLGLVIGLIVPRIKIWQSIVVIVVLVVSLSIVVFFLVFQGLNQIMLYWVPLLSIVLAFIGTLLYRILTEEKEKKFIKSRFSKYVSGSVVDELLKNPKALQLGGEDRFITVLFSDVRGFTTISEQLGEPQKLVALLNEYLSAMTSLIFKYDGTLDKYVGDEIMAFWGAPIPQEDHAYRACKSALVQIKYLYEVLHKKWDREKKPKMRIGIGINTGNMTVGNMGSESRMDYTLMGDNVNLGARLEGTNKVYTTSIIISEHTYEQVKDKVICRDLDIIKVKGKTKPVKIYELMDLKDEDVESPVLETVEK